MFQFPVPISFERHGGKRLRPVRSYAYAQALTIVPVVAAELGRIAPEMPVVFVRDGERWAAVAVLGVEQGCNLFVAPDGRWLAGYVPARIRQYPFVLGGAADGAVVLCVDEAAAALSDAEGHPLFEGPGQPSAPVRRAFDFLREMERDRQATAGAVAALADLLVPWEWAVDGGNGARRVGGLFRVDETRLNELSDEAFLALRRAGALAVAYAHLISLGRTVILDQLAAAHARRRPRKAATATPLLAAVDAAGDLVFDF